jgi:putative endonuclease
VLSGRSPVAFFTHIVASRRNGTPYTGSTEDIILRTAQHRDKLFKGFSAKYGCANLVWFEAHPTRHAAFVRERRIKKWNRVWKLELIERSNPGWRDLFDDLF